MNERYTYALVAVLAFTALYLDMDNGDSWNYVVSYTLGYMTKHNIQVRKEKKANDSAGKTASA